MFTIEQIKTAHSKVKSGADFPAYIQDLIALGVTGYDTYGADGHTDYAGSRGYKITSDSKYSRLDIAEHSDATQFKSDLSAHQQGHTDYPTFCSDCAKSGIEKWTVSMNDMICTYFDKAGNEVLAELIPQ
jgi:uncharacterized protein YbcV (DUF1398 family)